jgi:tetratricopeptide (TPR) repeat protein
MTEALIAELAQISSLRVISRTSVMHYKGSGKSLTQIARELNVDGIVEGSVFQDSQRVRITAQLIEAATDRHLWAKSYERDLRDILALHSEVARAVAREIKITLTADEEMRLATSRSVNPAAHEAYLKGQYHLQKYKMGGSERAEDLIRSSIEYFRQAIELDPDWASTHAALAEAYHFLASGYSLPEFYPKSKASALKALEIDETVANAHGSLAFVLHNYDWDWHAAEREFRRELELYPNSALWAWGVAIFFKSAGRYEEAITWYKRAEERNPLSLVVKAQLGHTYTAAGRYNEAIAHLQKTLELNQNYKWARYYLADTYLRKLMYQEAITEAQKAVAIDAKIDESLAQLGYAYAVAGRREKALKVLDQFEKRHADQFVNELAALYIALGKKDAALALLQQAFEERSPDLLSIRYSPVSDSLRDNPAFQDILRGINFPEGDIQIEARK